MKIYMILITFFIYVLLSRPLVESYSFLQDTAIVSDNIFTSSSISSAPSVPISPSPTISPSTDHLVISEVQISASGTGGTAHDFIEIYNPTSNPIDLNGHRLVKRTGTSTSDSTIKSWTTSDNVPPHGFYVWASTANGYNISINADASSSATIAANNSIALRKGPENTGQIIDALSWNSATQSLKEGLEFPTNPAENQSIERKAQAISTQVSMSESGTDVNKGNGFDSNNNANDFILRTVSQPQNSTSLAESL